MKFNECKFTLNTTVPGTKPVNTDFVLLAGEVDDDVVQEALLHTAPCVKWQTAEKRSGTIRTSVTMTWLEWLNPSTRSRVVQRDLTPEELFAKALANDAIMLQMKEHILRQMQESNDAA